MYKDEPEDQEARYSDLPLLEVWVEDFEVQTVYVPSAVTCAVGGNSVPLEVYIDLASFFDVTV